MSNDSFDLRLMLQALMQIHAPEFALISPEQGLCNLLP